MATPKIRPLLYAMLGAFGVGLSLIALIMLSQAAQNSENFDQLANSILWINILCLFVLMVLLIGNLSKLFRDYRLDIPGSKLKARMVGMFVGLAVIPLLIVFYFITKKNIYQPAIQTLYYLCQSLQLHLL